MLDTLSRLGGRLQSVPGGGGVGGVLAADPARLPAQPPDAAQAADAVVRYRVSLIDVERMRVRQRRSRALELASGEPLAELRASLC